MTRKTQIAVRPWEEPNMAEKLDPRQVATFEELLRACLYEQEALRRVLMRKGLLTNDECLKG